MRIFILFTLMALNYLCYAQVNYEPGYFITNSNERINCLIRNNDWINNPEKFQYKILEESTPQTAELKDVKEFGVGNSFKYRKFTVKIEYSGDNLEAMTNDPLPDFKTEELFLKVLLEGKASLYSYEGRSIVKYFFSINDQNPEQLIFKKYLYSGNEITENHSFRRQLQTNMSCGELPYSTFEKINYNSKDLLKFFNSYNNCEKSESVNYNNKAQRNSFNLTVKPGVNISSLEIHNTMISNASNFKTELSPRIGLEVEYILPFNKNAWSIVLEPNYQYYKSAISDSIPSKANYQTFEISLGLRRSFFLNDKSKIYLHGLFNLYFPFNSTIISKKYTLETKPGDSYILGLGYKYERYSLEMQYGFSKEILYDYGFFKSDYKVLAVVVGVSLFKPGK